MTGVRVICGDARAVLPDLQVEPARAVVLTDPVWPNAPPLAFGVQDPVTLFADVASHFPRLARRAVVQLNCRSDPRFLLGVPREMKFVRVAWLRYACPSYAGTVLNSGDVAYVFGSHEGPEGKVILPGECTSTRATGKETLEHPMPRRLEHVRWLVANFTRSTDTVIDPFAGSGTTLLACHELGRDCIGIERSAEFCGLISRRLAEAA